MLGCIADDFTGATDLANILVGNGMRVVQAIGIPDRPVGENVDAIVVALKSRTIPADEAVSQSLAAFIESLVTKDAHEAYAEGGLVSRLDPETWR